MNLSLESRKKISDRMKIRMRKENHPLWKGGITFDKRTYKREWSKKNREKISIYERDFKLKLTYGISQKEYENLLIKQNYKCAICLKNSSDFKRPLAVDHNHFTNKIRGLLCIKCNTGIGLFNENVDLFNKAIRYLKIGDKYGLAVNTCKN